MKRITIGTGWTIIIAVAAIPVAYCLARLLFLPVDFFMTAKEDQTFLDSGMGNWFATTVGLVVGIPLAFWINARQEKSEQVYRERETITRKRKILTLIKGELDLNKGILVDLLQKQETTAGVTYTTGLKDELWSALSDGGELQWIDKLDVLNALSDAYYHIRALIALEQHYFTLAFHEGIKGGGSHEWAQKIDTTVKGIRPGSLNAIQTALTTVEQSLASMAS